MNQGPFTVAASSVSSSNSVSVTNGGTDPNNQLLTTVYTIAPFVAVFGAYSFYASAIARRRRADNFRRSKLCCDKSDSFNLISHFRIQQE